MADVVEPATLTVDEAVQWLDPPIGRRQLADLITALRIRAVTTRPRPIGRPALAYDAAEIMRLHSALVEWLCAPKPPTATGQRRAATSRDG